MPGGGEGRHDRTKGLHLTGVIATAGPEDDPAVGENVGHGKIFRQPQGVPHGRNIEATAQLQPGGLGGQVDVEQQHIVAWMHGQLG